VVAGLTDTLDSKMIATWLAAADDLGIRVTAPVTLSDSAGNAFMCEALIHDFGSLTGAIVLSARTERRLRAEGRDPLKGYWSSSGGVGAYVRKQVIDTLEDFGWFGPRTATPKWYADRYGHGSSQG
jgi:hypothetical protein